MTVRVAVLDPLPMYARGLAATLGDHGFVTDTPAMAPRPGTALVLFTVDDEAGWPRLESTAAAVATVAVVDQVDAGAVLRAMTAGAVGVLARDAGAGEVVEAVRAALAGRSVLPATVLRALLSDRPADPVVRPVSDDEIGWLRRLADGITVAKLAESVGYSERMMFRLLADLYARLGADNRTRALIRARDEGWL